MTRSQAAESCGLRPETLRYYERIGLDPRPARAPNAYRDYVDPDLKRFAFIRKARDMGFSIAEIRASWECFPSGRASGKTGRRWSNGKSTIWENALTMRASCETR